MLYHFENAQHLLYKCNACVCSAVLIFEKYIGYVFSGINVYIFTRFYTHCIRGLIVNVLFNVIGIKYNVRMVRHCAYS